MRSTKMPGEASIQLYLDRVTSNCHSHLRRCWLRDKKPPVAVGGKRYQIVMISVLRERRMPPPDGRKFRDLVLTLKPVGG
jgi:hypothetical protein